MRIFNPYQRRIYGEKALDFSLVAIGALVFAQVASSQGLSWPLVVLGLILFILGLVGSYLFLKGVKGGDDT